MVIAVKISLLSYNISEVVQKQHSPSTLIGRKTFKVKTTKIHTFNYAYSHLTKKKKLCLFPSWSNNTWLSDIQSRCGSQCRLRCNIPSIGGWHCKYKPTHKTNEKSDIPRYIYQCCKHQNSNQLG